MKIDAAADRLLAAVEAPALADLVEGGGMPEPSLAGMLAMEAAIYAEMRAG